MSVSSRIHPVRQKNCTDLFLQQLSQIVIYYDNFWHTYTSINFLSYVYYIFFISSETGNQLKFENYSGPAHCAHTAIVQLRREMPDFNYSATSVFLTFQTLVHDL